MPATSSPGRADDLDDILDYDDAVNDFWKDLPDANNDSTNKTNNQPVEETNMDEEVKVTKKRKPNPKLDQDRLLSSAGIPKLRRIAKDKLKFKGKGHEFSDIARMLNLYQLWLDDLYPKAKFRDALTMVEKVGHTKRMQVSRRAWIDETKSYRRREDDDAEMRLGDHEQDEDEAIFPVPSAAKGDSQTGQDQEAGGDAPDEDELDALLGEQAAGPPEKAPAAPPKNKGPFEDDEPDEDELDALMNEDTGATSRPHTNEAKGQPGQLKGPFEEDEDDPDDLDMLLAEDTRQGQANHNVSQSSKTATSGASGNEQDFADEEEAMAEMGW